MNRKLVAAATVVLVAGVAVVVFGAVGRSARPPSPPTAPSSGHGPGIDHAMSAVLALYHAPVGSSPCESAYNAFKASLDVSTQQNSTPVVLWLAPHDDFLSRCNALPPPTQQCLVPLYLSEHRAECQKAKPSDDILNTLAQLKRAAEPGSQGPDQSEPPPFAPR